jgi:hypothetical protein
MVQYYNSKWLTSSSLSLKSGSILGFGPGPTVVQPFCSGLLPVLIAPRLLVKPNAGKDGPAPGFGVSRIFRGDGP